jgi:hypothetical protein
MLRLFVRFAFFVFASFLSGFLCAVFAALGIARPSVYFHHDAVESEREQ